MNYTHSISLAMEQKYPKVSDYFFLPLLVLGLER